MKKISTFLKKGKNQLIVLGLTILLIHGCYEWRHILQPSTADVNSSFDVTIVLDKQADGDYTTPLIDTGLFGALLPLGWAVEDSFQFKKEATDDSTDITGKIAYSAFVSQKLQTKNPAPEGYYWWGGKTIDVVNNLHMDSIYFTFTVLTDTAKGTFNLKYTIGDLENAQGERDPYRIISENMPVTIGAGTSNVKSLWDKAELSVYPNPSNGKFFVNFSGLSSTELNVYDLNGRQVYNQLLENNSNYLNLAHLSKGRYILSLKNNGQITTKKIIIK